MAKARPGLGAEQAVVSVDGSRRYGLGFFRFSGLLGGDLFYRAGWEIEADLAVFHVEGEVGVEFPLGAVGDEAFEDVGFAEADELEHLIAGDFALEDGLADADAVGVLFGDDFWDVVGLVGGVNLVGFSFFGFRLADELLLGEFGWPVAVVALEDEVDLELSVHFERGVEGLVELRAEARERADELGGEELDGFWLGE